MSGATAELKIALRLRVAAQSAAAGPPLGPILGQHGIPINDFCKKFNEVSNQYPKGMPLKSVVQIYTNREFKITIKGVPTADLIKKACGLSKFAGKVNEVSKEMPVVTNLQLFELFKKEIEEYGPGFLKSVVGFIRNSGGVVINLPRASEEDLQALLEKQQQEKQPQGKGKAKFE